MSLPHHDLWALIDQLPRDLPFARQGVEARLGATLHTRSDNGYFVFWEGGGVALADGLRIDQIDLRIRRVQPHPGFLVLRLDGACVPKSAVFERYPGMALVDFPRGRSPDEEASFGHQAPWGRLGFGFAERRSDCLSSLVIAPRDEGGGASR